MLMLLNLCKSASKPCNHPSFSQNVWYTKTEIERVSLNKNILSTWVIQKKSLVWNNLFFTDRQWNGPLEAQTATLHNYFGLLPQTHTNYATKSQKSCKCRPLHVVGASKTRFTRTKPSASFSGGLEKKAL